jgi:predicted AAA+ superfamily ATPase
MIKRIYDDLGKILQNGKVTVIYGPRRVGKTTLINNFLKTTQLKYRLENGDDINVGRILSSRSREQIGDLVAGYDLLVVDEAQRIADVGLGLKILVDNNPDIKVLISGSSSLNLSYRVGEPLVGRAFDYFLFPVSQLELLKVESSYDLKDRKDEFLVFGGYPEVLEAKTKEKKMSILTQIANAYLLRDIVELERVADGKVLIDLLKLIAFQVGSEVSLSELGSNLGIDRKTVARYLWLFEQSFVLCNLAGFSRNLRKEVTSKSKYYFYDNGIRNAIINNFNDLNTRNDVGQLWENFVVMERVKKQKYTPIYANNYFWRTWDKKEIDWVEEREGKLYGFEIKWGRLRSAKSKDGWLQTYKKEALYQVVDSDNYLEFVG